MMEWKQAKQVKAIEKLKQLARQGILWVGEVQDVNAVEKILQKKKGQLPVMAQPQPS